MSLSLFSVTMLKHACMTFSSLKDGRRCMDGKLENDFCTLRLSCTGSRKSFSVSSSLGDGELSNMQSCNAGSNAPLFAPYPTAANESMLDGTAPDAFGLRFCRVLFVATVPAAFAPTFAARV